MAFVGIRDLSRETSRVIKRFEDSGEPLIITREGKPIGALMPVTERQVEDIVMATAPQFRPEPLDAETPEEAQSLEEYAAEQGVVIGEQPQVPEAAAVDAEASASESADFAERSVSAIATELRPLMALLSEPDAAEVMTRAAAELRAANDEALLTFHGPSAETDELQEAADLAAALYGRLLRAHLPFSFLQDPTPEAVSEASESAAKELRVFNLSMSRNPDLSVPTYVAAIRAVESLDLEPRRISARELGVEAAPAAPANSSH